MNSKQKNTLIILLGIEVGITIFFFLYTSPVLSAWIPTAPGASLEDMDQAPASIADVPIALSPTETEPPRTPTNIPGQFLPVSPTQSLTPLIPTEPPGDLALLAQSFPESFAQTPPIWFHTAQPADHEVVLFRHVFEMDEPTTLAELQIFADTRYEIWLDGTWVGRGPARFSCTLREYDVYPLETLAPGPHHLAVLVQWAPNARRSESNTPLLQARLQQYTPNGPVTLVQTGPDWHAFSAAAWNPDAGLVHSWELIGPMELLDFRYLPQNWTQPGFSDSTWAKAIQTTSFTNAAKTASLASQVCSRRGIAAPYIPTYQPRSIPLLTSTSLTPTLFEAGWLSPNRLMVQPDRSQNNSDFTFNVTEPVVFTIEVLALSSSTSMYSSPSMYSSSITDTLLLDNLPLTWLPAGENRPDVWVGLSPVAPGLHTLTNRLNAFPVFDLFTDGLQLNPHPLNQGTHPGYRMLLAEPVPDDSDGYIGSVLHPLAGEGLNLRFDQTPSYLVLELPRVAHGRLVAEVLGPPGTIIDIGWDEKLFNAPGDVPIGDEYIGRPLPFPGSLHPHWSQVDSWVLDGNYRDLTTLDTRAGRYILIAVWGNGPVEFHNLRVVEEQYPVTPRGTFISSDVFLNQVWQVGTDTTRLNMFDAYADPWREHGQWWGDAFIVDRTNRVAFGETALLRRGLLYMADGFKNGYPSALAPNGLGNHMLDYAMLWVQSLESYAALTQDQTFVAQVYPTVQAFLAYLKKNTQNTTGLLNIPTAHWSRSTYIDTRAHYSRYGQSAAVNAMYYGTLQSAANLADMLSDTASAETWRAQAENVKQQINTLLYLPDEGRYAATRLSSRLYVPDPYAQAWPLAYGVVPESEIPRVTAALLELLSTDPQKPNVDIYGMNWVLEALGRNGYIPEALDILDLYYGYMLNAGATNWWESFLTPESYHSARSHGWGSSPTWFLTTYVLGGQWTGPESWVVRPALEGVASASGALPIGGAGEVYIAWEIQSCSLIEIEISAPSHTEGELVLPFANVNNLVLNGVTILKDGTSLVKEVSVLADSIHISLSNRPQYSLTVERACP